MVDRYTKIVLTIIALSLCVLVIQNSIPTANAVGQDCGSWSSPCHVKVTNRVDVKVLGSVHT